MSRDQFALATGRAEPVPYPSRWAEARGLISGTYEPTSPLQLAQEMVATPWQSVVAAMMHVRTRRQQAHPALWSLLARCPDPVSLLRLGHGEVYRIIRSCGFGRKRALDLAVMSVDYAYGARPPELHGAGEYVTHSWKVFVEGDLHCSPRDRELAAFVVWALGRKRNGLSWRPKYLDEDAGDLRERTSWLEDALNDWKDELH